MTLWLKTIFLIPYFEMLDRYWPIVVQGSLVSVTLGLIGCFLVVKGTSLLGDALSHSVLPGIVIGFLISGSLHSPWILIGASAFGLLAAALVQSVHSHSRVKEDASLGIVFTTLFAIGVVLINIYSQQADLDPGCVLYGNLEHFIVDHDAIWPMVYILAGVVVLLLLFYRHLLVCTFDPALAVSLGLPVALITYSQMAALSLSIVASFEAVGAILAVALLILPGATARMWTDRMPAMLVVATIHGILSSIIGYWLSHPAILNSSAAGAICVAGFGLFILSWLLAPRQGLVMREFHRRQLNASVAVENLVKTIEELSTGMPPALSEAKLISEMKLSPRRLQRAKKRAIAMNWIAQNGGQLFLTDAGQAHGRHLTHAHQLWELYLLEQLGVAPDHVHDAAEWIEHHLSDTDLLQLESLLAKRAAETTATPE